MADNEETTTTDYEAQIAELQKQLAEREEGDPNNFEIRFNKEKQKREEYAAKVVELESKLKQTVDDYTAKEEERNLKAGNVSDVIDSQKATIKDLESKLAKSQLDVERLIIGRNAGLPDEIARLLPGSDIAEIKASAETVAGSIPKPTGYSDARGGGNALQSVQNNARKTTHHHIIDGAF